jgi:hypothetical protein
VLLSPKAVLWVAKSNRGARVRFARDSATHRISRVAFSQRDLRSLNTRAFGASASEGEQRKGARDAQASTCACTCALYRVPSCAFGASKCFAEGE